MTPEEKELEHTTPENRGVCGFCGGEEGGYAKQDKKGAWKAACWDCVKPENPKQMVKRKIKVDPPPKD